MNIEQILRTAEVRRFHILRLAVEQTVGEHVYCVTQIAKELFRELAFKPIGWDIRDLVYACSFHDIEEGLTGDLPSPAKRALLARGIDWNHLAEELVPECGGTVQMIEDYIKMADLLDAWRFVQTYKISPHGMLVRDRLHASVREHAFHLQQSGRWQDCNVDWWEATRRVMLSLTQPVKELSDERISGKQNVRALAIVEQKVLPEDKF